jgi:hypothetical protein
MMKVNEELVSAGGLTRPYEVDFHPFLTQSRSKLMA